MGGNNEFFENFERNKYLKKLPSMQRVKGGRLRRHVSSGRNRECSVKMMLCSTITWMLQYKSASTEPQLGHLPSHSFLFLQAGTDK